LSSPLFVGEVEEEPLIRSFQRAIALAALLVLTIDSNAMGRLSQQSRSAGFLPAHESQDRQVAQALPRDRPASWFSPKKTLALSIAPPAVMLVERATLVDLRQDIEDAMFGDTSASFAKQRFFLSSGTSSDDSPAFELDTEPLSREGIALSATLIFLLSMILGLTARWVIGRPLQDLATAFRETAGDCLPAEVVAGKGHKISRQLTRAFGEMKHRRYIARAHQSETLTALALHLESHAMRLRKTALRVTEWQKRVALVEDIDLFSYISRQFVQVTRCSPRHETDVPVEAFLRDRFMMTSSLDAAHFDCTFEAGADFSLPRTLLERVMSNLVDNALEHGIPPIEIKTSRRRDEWLLTIRDHGAGITQAELSDATSAFVRLGNDEDDGRHWGLGLALVKTLVASAEGRLILGNHPGGGLIVRMLFPAPNRIP
jgi:signal transduction histidine kinase